MAQFVSITSHFFHLLRPSILSDTDTSKPEQHMTTLLYSQKSLFTHQQHCTTPIFTKTKKTKQSPLWYSSAMPLSRPLYKEETQTTYHRDHTGVFLPERRSVRIKKVTASRLLQLDISHYSESPPVSLLFSRRQKFQDEVDSDIRRFSRRLLNEAVPHLTINKLHLIEKLFEHAVVLWGTNMGGI